MNQGNGSGMPPKDSESWNEVDRFGSRVKSFTLERLRHRVVARNILVIAVARFHHNNSVLRACLRPSSELERAIRAHKGLRRDELRSLLRVYRFRASEELERAVQANNRVLNEEIWIALCRLGGLLGEW